MFKIIIFFLFSTISLAQTQRTLTGVVLSVANVNLESANVIAKPLKEKKNLKFAITDNKGRYRLELETGIDYEINVSYIGFMDETLTVKFNSDIFTHDFILKPSGENLKEIIIRHEYKAIEIKKDTLTFNVKSFANGNERKMKEILEKLPGVEVDKNGIVTVQGKQVTQMLVEGKSFFGGGSKLAVENIPADAIDKIEVIDNFNEVGFMKKVSDSDELAMNVKLKEDKKEFVFGDIEAGLGLGIDKSNLIHSGLFYYTPKLNVSFIGDVNNIGKSTFTYADLRRFTNGSSNYILKRKLSNNLYSLTKDNTDVLKNKSQFEAISISYNFSPKLSISGFSIFSKISSKARNIAQNEYLENKAQTYENKVENNHYINVLNITNFKIDYAVTKNEKIFYNTQFQSCANDLKGAVNSFTNADSSTFKALNDADNISFKHYLEWHKNYSLTHTTTLAIGQSFDNNKTGNQWLTNQSFLVGFLPLKEDTNYKINQIKNLKTNIIDAVFKHYWIINDHNHLYTNFGNNFENSDFETSEMQLLSDNSINNFNTAGYGNKTKYQLNDLYLGLEYKFKIGKLTNNAGLYYHFYDLKSHQIDVDYEFSKKLFQPRLSSDYQFNQSEKISFNYKLEANFPEVNLLSNRYTLEKYNLVYKGNAILQNGKYHSLNLIYTKMSMYKGIFWNGFLNFTKKTAILRNEVGVDGINQFNMPVLIKDPETNVLFNGSIMKKIYHFELKLNANLSWLNYYQKLNNTVTLNDRNSQNFELRIKTNYKEWPSLSIGYEKGYSHFTGLTRSSYQSDQLNSDLEFTFFKFWTYKVNYQYLKNINSNKQSNYYEVTDTSLQYQKKNSAFGFELVCKNLFDVQRKNSYTFSDYIISQQSTYVLPRIMMFSISYKL